MATIRAYTTIEQSSKLAEILQIESADMYYFRQIDSDYFPPDVESICPIPLFKDGKEDFNYDIPCWSLAALLGVLPILNDRSPVLSKTFDRKYRVVYHSTAYEMAIITSDYNNPVDACVAMIERLHEQKLL